MKFIDRILCLIGVYAWGLCEKIKIQFTKFALSDYANPFLIILMVSVAFWLLFGMPKHEEKNVEITHEQYAYLKSICENDDRACDVVAQYLDDDKITKGEYASIVNTYKKSSILKKAIRNKKRQEKHE
jgi:hypothetical protein